MPMLYLILFLYLLVLFWTCKGLILKYHNSHRPFNESLTIIFIRILVVIFIVHLVSTYMQLTDVSVLPGKYSRLNLGNKYEVDKLGY
jgi:hypothetical protein